MNGDRGSPVRRAAIVFALSCVVWAAAGAWQIISAVGEMREARSSAADIQELDASADLRRAQ